MRKVFLDDLPRNGKLISWKNSVGCKVKFIYDGIEGELQIKSYYSQNRYLSIEWNRKEHKIYSGDFANARLGNILGVVTKDYKYNIGDVIELKTGKVKIINQTRGNRGKYGCKSYEYLCLNEGCGDIGKINEGNEKTYGCAVCSNKKVKKGVNDIATTNHELIKYFVNVEDSYKYSYGTSKKVNLKCPNCNHEKLMPIQRLHRQGFACPKCSDGISYPEKIMFNILDQLNVEFIYQMSEFNWSKNVVCENEKLNGNKFYDFYIPFLNTIIETHGALHYIDGFGRIGGRSLAEETENDRLKEDLARENGIKYYITIDCRVSDLLYIKNNVLESKLNNIFNLSSIDWLKCHEYACNSLVKVVCNLWENGVRSTLKISQIVKLHRSCIIKYLKQGVKLGWCDYNPKDEMIKGMKNGTKETAYKRYKKIICLNTRKVFDSIKQASEELNINKECLSMCCSNKIHSAGRDKEGKRLIWVYYDDYLKMNEDDIQEKLNNIENIPENIPKKIIRLDTLEIYEGLIDVYNKHGFLQSAIANCIKGKSKSSYGVKWMLYDEYLKINNLIYS